MATLATLVVPIILVVGLALYKWILQPAFLSPLARIPNAHWSASISQLWIFGKRFAQRDTFAIHDAHRRLGPVVRLAPNDVSVNSIEGVQAVYGGNLEKDAWYANIFTNYGIRPMFAMSGNAEHSQRKRMLGNIYSKSTLLSSPAVDAISRTMVKDRLVSRLKQGTGGPVEFYELYLAFTLDYVTAYCYGLKAGSNLLSQPDLARSYTKAYKARIKGVSFPQELPTATPWLGRWGILSLVLPHSDEHWDVEEWALEMQDKAEETFGLEASSKRSDVGAGDWPTVYAQMRKGLHGESKDRLSEHTRLSIASEMVDHIFAGFDTGSMVLLYLTWEISKPENKVWQSKLRNELSTLPEGNVANARTLDGLPVLHALVMETLRMHPPVAGSQVRVTPPTTMILNTTGSTQPTIELPPRTRIQAQAWSLHREPTAFPEPDCWRPSRWLGSSAELKEMNRWFWAFGSGARMCTGMNLGMIELKTVAASIWRSFETDIVDDVGMEHNGGFLAGPLGSPTKDYLKIKMKDLATGE